MALSKTQKEQRTAGKENNAKGLAFQIEFGEYMKKELGWRGYRENVDLSHNKGSNEIDVLAERNSEFGAKLKGLTKGFIVISALSLCLGMIIPAIFQNSAIATGIGIGLPQAALIILPVAILAYAISYKFIVEHAWVECKNTKETVNIEQVATLWSKYELYKKSGSRSFKFKEIYFVSANGYVESALRFALDRKIKCYIKDKNGIFAEVHYWK